MQLEHQIRCQCGCTLDVYTCRTTDFSCQVSPAMHRDVMSLVEGGYSAQEILDAFVDTYGERALMAPKKEGFNLAGYSCRSRRSVPARSHSSRFSAACRERRRRPLRRPRLRQHAPDATDDELARLDAAIRRDD